MLTTALHTHTLPSFPAVTDSQFGEAGSAHSSGDGFDGGEQGVEEEGQAPRRTLDLALFVQHEPRESHGVHVDLLFRKRRGSLRHGCFLFDPSDLASKGRSTRS